MASNKPIRFGNLGSSLNIFSSKSLPVRRPTALSPIASYGELFQAEQNGEILDPTLRLDSALYEFDDGTWELRESDGADAPKTPKRARVSDQVRTEMNALREQNNYLALKNEALLNMLAEVVALTNFGGRNQEASSSSEKESNG